jgi:hypothetical protein
LGINKCTISNETVAFLLSGYAPQRKELFKKSTVNSCVTTFEEVEESYRI